MRSKALIRNIALPEAPKPTLPVRIDDKPPISTVITKERREKAVAASNKTRIGLWTYEEERNLKKLVRRGLSTKEIAEHFPARTLSAVSSKIRKMRLRGQI